MIQLLATIENRQSGQEVAKIEPSDSARKRTWAKTHKEFWKERLERRCYTLEGQLHEVNEYSVRIQHLGKRKSVALGTSNAEAAAIKAKDYYLTIVAKGWEAAELEFNPAMIVSKNDPSVADFLKEVEAIGDFEPKTFRNYAGYFRRVVADIFGVKTEKSKFDYRSGGTATWRDKVDAVKLNQVTPELINKWRMDYVRQSPNNPLARARATRSANSYIRCARALFSKKFLKDLKLKLPDPLPFTGVRVERYRSPRYQSTIEATDLLLAARKELSETNSPAYLALLLALGAGLRKSEIDGLEWKHVNFAKNTIIVEETEFRGVKTDKSVAEVQIDPDLSSELKGFLPAEQAHFVLESKRAARPEKTYQYYRAEPVFRELYQWLRKKEIKTRCPLHTLRKEFGSVINHHYGLYAAMTALRHSNIQTTSSYYMDNKQRIAMPVGTVFKKTEPGSK